jgi:hypothetical protein
MVSQTQLDIAYAIMASFGGSGPQRDLLERVIKTERMEKELRQKLLSACKEYSRLTPQRNKIIHGRWAIIGSGESFRTLRVGNTKQLRYLDQYLRKGEDPQSAVFTIDMLKVFTEDCQRLSKQMYALADDPMMRKRFPLII